MRNEIVLSQAYPVRIESVQALIAAADARVNSAGRLRSAAEGLDGTGTLYGRASTAAVYGAFAELLRAAAYLLDWRHAILHAEVDAGRFLNAAKTRHQLWIKEYANLDAVAGLTDSARLIESAAHIDDVARVCLQLASTPLPVGVFSNPVPPAPRIPRDDIEAKVREVPEQLAVAFLRFQLDGQPASETHFLTPNQVHDVEIEVRVSRWPAHATHLALSPLSIEPSSSYELPIFEFARPKGEPPFILRERGRALLHVAQGMNARPSEFKYTAAFKPDQSEKPVVVGHRTLVIESYDLASHPITGYAAIDKKLIKIRDEIRQKSSYVPAPDLSNLLVLLKPLCNLAGRAIQDSLFRDATDEKEFQIELRKLLRQDPAIGSELEEHANAAGGITDLSFRGIRLELKFAKSKTPVKIDDCAGFAQQTVAYVVGTGKRVGVLCVLDNGPKKTPAFPAEEGITLQSLPTKEGTIEIVVIIIQGNLPRPSDLSR